MENFSVHLEKDKLISDITDSVKFIKLPGAKAKKLAHLALHKIDLQYAEDYLKHMDNNNHIIQKALWESAIARYFRCYKASASRSQLDSQKIYKEKPMGLDAHNYFNELRNKHTIHDENNYSQSIPCAALNNGQKSYKIEKIVCLSVTVLTLNQSDYDNLRLLIQDTLDFVGSEFDKLCQSITSDLEKLSYEDLIQYEPVEYKTPVVEDVGKTRER